jgi:hypothetical protein
MRLEHQAMTAPITTPITAGAVPTISRLPCPGEIAVLRRNHPTAENVSYTVRLLVSDVVVGHESTWAVGMVQSMHAYARRGGTHLNPVTLPATHQPAMLDLQYLVAVEPSRWAADQ